MLDREESILNFKKLFFLAHVLLYMLRMEVIKVCRLSLGIL